MPKALEEEMRVAFASATVTAMIDVESLVGRDRWDGRNWQQVLHCQCQQVVKCNIVQWPDDIRLFVRGKEPLCEGVAEGGQGSAPVCSDSDKKFQTQGEGDAVAHSTGEEP